MVLNKLQGHGMRSFIKFFFNFIFFIKYDHSFFPYKHQYITLHARVLVCVDDILLARSSYILIHDLIYKFHDKFSLKKLEILEYYKNLSRKIWVLITRSPSTLSHEVKYHHSGSLFLTQKNYVKDFLPIVNIVRCKWDKHTYDSSLQA